MHCACRPHKYFSRMEKRFIASNLHFISEILLISIRNLRSDGIIFECVLFLMEIALSIPTRHNVNKSMEDEKI